MIPTATGKPPQALICVTDLPPAGLLTPMPNAQQRFDLPDFIAQAPNLTKHPRVKFFSLWQKLSRAARSQLSDENPTLYFEGSDTVAINFGFYRLVQDQSTTRSYVLDTPRALRQDVHYSLPLDSLTRPMCFFYLGIDALGLREDVSHG